MRKLIDLTGQRYGKWTVKRRAERDKAGRARWLCICDCGKEISVDMCNLRTGASPGCMSCGNSHPAGIAAFNWLYANYRSQAKRRGLCWQLTKDQFRTLTSSPCYYTGLLPSNVMRTIRGQYSFNGIDRLDNSKGYTTDNCVACCAKINEMKMDSTYGSFIAMCRAVSARSYTEAI